MKIQIVMGAAVAAMMSTFAGSQNDIARFDPAMAVKGATITNGVKWIDGKLLPLEGRAFDDTECFYDRLPANVTTNVNEGVRSMKHHTSGMLFRFRTDSTKLTIKWTPFDSRLEMDHMPATGVSGIDIYHYDEKRGKWLYLKTGRITDWKNGASVSVAWKPGEACIVNLPLYNGIKTFELGIDPKATIEAVPHKSGIEKPVVFYGTSITHGGCCSRPGTAFVNWVGRDLEVPVVGLGFSGSGCMEYEMSEHLARIDASCYVLDCLWNMRSNVSNSVRNVECNYEPFIRNLRAKRPDVPIVMAEQSNVFGNGPNEKDRFILKLYERLIAEGWKHLVYLPAKDMYSGDTEGTVDGSHPNDYGMYTMKNAFGAAVRQALEK